MKGPWSLRPNNSDVRCGRLLTSLLLLFCGFSIAVGQSQTDPIPGNTGGHSFDFHSFQNKFAEMLVWSEPIADSIISFVHESQAKVLLEILKDCPRKEFFFSFNPSHMRAVTSLQNVLMGQESPHDWLEMASGFRELVNPHVWVRAVYTSAIHREDLQSLVLPPVVEVMPSLFISSEILDRATRSSDRADTCIMIDGNWGSDNGAENALWYFREDVGLNSNHWFWHLSYPLGGTIQPDRNGELFYFMHHDFLSRYHSERLSSGLAPIQEYVMKNGSQIPFGYNAHLNDTNSGYNWTPRPAATNALDIPSGNAFGVSPIKIQDRTTQKTRILDAISKGYLNVTKTQMNTNGTVALNSTKGITLLGDVIIANVFSINRTYYGVNGIHNDGHIVTCLAVDPGNKKRLPPGVMGDTSTSMRDVIFYPYHKEIDVVFSVYKNTLPAYQLDKGEWPLLLKGITVQSLSVQSGNLSSNELHTFWNSRSFDLSRGLDFDRPLSNGKLQICEKILDHQDFQYQIQIKRDPAVFKSSTVTVRLFMAPRFDLNGKRYTLEEERNFMFILDSFRVQFQDGTDTYLIKRSSLDTPLTIDFTQSLGQLANSTVKPFCGCGWPQHRLIPKGTKAGLLFDLFALVTNAVDDQVVQSVPADSASCISAYIYCGLVGKKYPDARPMGYPFDRKLYNSGVSTATLEQLITDVPNSGMAQVKIVHIDATRKVRRNYGVD